jgi:2-polyprenyl-6-methoxyphenol hydroxylase-like FAD-dependent oxidoreductase
MVDLDTLAIWPYYVVPKLETWYSHNKRVIILGDAAHAIPPTAGQGAPQGFKDVHTLAALLPQIAPRLPLDKALMDWKAVRQTRVDKVIQLTLQLNNARLPQAERESLAAAGTSVRQSDDHGELGWMYNADVEKNVLLYVKAETKEKKTCLVEWLQAKLTPGMG